MRSTPPTPRPQRRIMIAVTAATAVALTGCVNPFPGIQFTPEETTTPTGQANAPYPADLDHLDDILTLGKTTLPEGATDITVSPALKTAEDSPGAWGYVIAYHAEPQPIRDHVEKYTGHAGKYVEVFSDSGPVSYIKDIDLNTIQHPWVTGFENAQLVIERPLGRCWLIIRGGFR